MWKVCPIFYFDHPKKFCPAPTNRCAPPGGLIMTLLCSLLHSAKPSPEHARNLTLTFDLKPRYRKLHTPASLNTKLQFFPILLKVAEKCCTFHKMWQAFLAFVLSPQPLSTLWGQTNTKVGTHFTLNFRHWKSQKSLKKKVDLYAALLSLETWKTHFPIVWQVAWSVDLSCLCCHWRLWRHFCLNDRLSLFIHAGGGGFSCLIFVRGCANTVS